MSERPCQLCECPLTFVKTPSGSTMPLDTRAELYRIVVKDGKEVAERVSREERIYVTHFRTCVHAARFSGGRK